MVKFINDNDTNFYNILFFDVFRKGQPIKNLKKIVFCRRAKKSPFLFTPKQAQTSTKHKHAQKLQNLSVFLFYDKLYLKTIFVEI